MLACFSRLLSVYISITESSSCVISLLIITTALLQKGPHICLTWFTGHSRFKVAFWRYYRLLLAINDTLWAMVSFLSYYSRKVSLGLSLATNLLQGINLFLALLVSDIQFKLFLCLCRLTWCYGYCFCMAFICLCCGVPWGVGLRRWDH